MLFLPLLFCVLFVATLIPDSWLFVTDAFEQMEARVETEGCSTEKEWGLPNVRLMAFRAVVGRFLASTSVHLHLSPGHYYLLARHVKVNYFLGRGRAVPRGEKWESDYTISMFHFGGHKSRQRRQRVAVAREHPKSLSLLEKFIWRWQFTDLFTRKLGCFQSITQHYFVKYISRRGRWRRQRLWWWQPPQQRQSNSWRAACTGGGEILIALFCLDTQSAAAVVGFPFEDNIHPLKT